MRIPPKIFVVCSLSTAVAAAQPEQPPLNHFTPAEIATGSCWIDAATGEGVPTFPPGYRGLDDPNHYSIPSREGRPARDLVRTPDSGWIDAATGESVPTFPPGYHPGLDDPNHYSIPSREGRPGRNLVRIPCPQPQASTTATNVISGTSSATPAPVGPVADIISATAVLKARIGPCPPPELHDDVARLRRKLRRLVDAAVEAGTPLDATATAQITAADASLVRLDYNITELRAKCARAAGARTQTAPAASTASAASEATPPKGSVASRHDVLAPPIPVTVLASARILQIHNDERESLNIPPLHWDPVLAQHASDYAQQLAQNGHLVHATREGRGIERENLQQGIIGWSTDQMLQRWVDERRYFHPGIYPNVCDSDWSRCAHYTQMIWPTTTAIGCGEATGSGYQWLVCRYSPGGNRDGEPLEPEPHSPERGM